MIPAAGSASHAAVAVPGPFPVPLTYELPADLAPFARVGVRVRVPLGKRRAIGWLVDLAVEPPAGIALKPIEAVLDLEPLLPSDLLELARFVADYYLAPLGEVLRAVVPSGLPPWGDRRVGLTDRGALAPPRDEVERRLVGALLGRGRIRLADLVRELGDAGLGERVERLVAERRLTVEDPERRGARYVSAFELVAGDRVAQRAAAGRSAAGQAVVDFLAALGRPATQREICRECGCTPAVIARLARLGVVKKFSQPERLELGEHRLSAADSPVAAIELREDQTAALVAIRGALDERRFAAYLLRGMTGSGKTEVYLRAASACLERGRSALLLVPEIALVPALAKTAAERFGDRLALAHSSLSSGERHQEWERARRGEARVVIGPRSAVFAPLENLGLIVVDEEQDPAYKQESTPRYHGRDIALVRARAAGAVAVLVSATPALESRVNVERGRLAPLVLTRRVGQGELPEGILVDLRQEARVRRSGEIVFSARLLDELGRCLAAGDQAILLRNRRGYAPLLLCRACGEDFRCDDCGLPRTLHRRDSRLLCHYCGGSRPVPALCPICGAEALEAVGAGTERVEEEIAQLFPGTAIDVLDRDAVRRRGGVAAVLERFQRGDTRLLVGTQMVSKGHHFPGVALTAVLSADSYLGFPDFRAVEKTYALLTQVAGRAGRGARPGRLVLQSFLPEHYAIRAALAHDDALFEASEMRFRRAFAYPPFTRMIQLLATDRRRERALERLSEVLRRLEPQREELDLRITGPAPAPLERLRGSWRFQALVRSRHGARLRDAVRQALGDRPAAEVVVDVDPYQLL
ncbi:MAG: primosomal protein N' [Thermoanaerobaculia bacterium]